jgi:hypothetical protein
MKIRKIGSEDAFFMDCECCSMEFQCGPHVYNGQNVPEWGVPMCHSCKPPFRQNHEISPTPRLLAVLKSKGISVTLNERGMLSIS